MITYIIIAYTITILRELYVAFNKKQSISFMSWIWVAFAPVTLPITIIVMTIISYKETLIGKK